MLPEALLESEAHRYTNVQRISVGVHMGVSCCRAVELQDSRAELQGYRLLELWMGGAGPVHTDGLTAACMTVGMGYTMQWGSR